MKNPNICMNCKWFNLVGPCLPNGFNLPPVELGTCHKNAPVLGNMYFDFFPHRGFPPMPPDGWCGDFEPIAK